MNDQDSTVDPMSYSVYIDGNVSNVTNSLNNNITTFPPAEIKPLQQRKIHSWIKDEAIISCYNCKGEFTYYNRKHHCRSCGRIFCNSCCNIFADIDQYDAKYFPAELPKTNIGKIFDHIQSHTSQQSGVRICNSCDERIKEWKIISEPYAALEKNSTVIKVNDITKYKSHSDCRAGIFYLSQFREIQYRLPFKPFSCTEENLLNNNKQLFGGHSQWIYQFIMNVDTSIPSNMLYIENLLKANKEYDCMSLMCSSQCNIQLQPFQVCSILQSKALSDEIIQLFIPILDDIDNDVFENYLMMFINKLIEENCVNVNSLTIYIFQRSSQSSKAANDLMMCINTALLSENKHNNVISIIKQQFIDYLTSQSHTEILNTVKHISTIIQPLSSNYITESYIKNEFASIVSSSNSVTLPFKVHCSYVNIDTNNVQMKKSKCTPILIPFKKVVECNSPQQLSQSHSLEDLSHLNNVMSSVRLSPTKSIIEYETDYILFKKEDLRQDYIICKIIKLMMHIIKVELKIDIDLISYDVVPLDRTKGLVEIIPDSETINDINKNQISILNHILNNNPNETASSIRNNFCKSTAAYCIITYLLGIEDRHLDNIMIHKTGRLFHVDFGYILGCDPKYVTSNIRITPDMLDAIGGKKSENYKQFCSTCVQIYNGIRKYATFFSCVLLQLNKINKTVYTTDRIEAEVTKRFEPGVNNEDGEKHLLNLITNDQSNDWKYQLNDFVHSAVSKISFS